MIPSCISKVLLGAGTLALLYGCGRSTKNWPDDSAIQPTAGSGPATAGSISVGTAGSETEAGGATTTGAGGAPMTTSGSGGVAEAGAPSDGGVPSGGGAGPDDDDSPGDIKKVWPSNGCGRDYDGPTGSTITMLTKGVKDANCSAKLQNGTPRCGAWGQPGSAWLTEPLPRDYYLYLPDGYDSTKAYPIVFQGGGCGSNGTQVYSLNDGTADNASNSVIRVGLTPAPSDVIGHGCCPFGCFDDKEGDDSVDWVLYEDLYDKLNEELCFDRNRVFAAGHSSGAWLANELGCKYAGDPKRPVRAALSNGGGLPVTVPEAPTCTQAPMAGIWVVETNDPDNPPINSKVALNRVLKANGCAAPNYDVAVKEPFPIGAGQAEDRCKRVTSCNPLYPLVVCEMSGSAHGSHDNVVNPGFSKFLKLFSSGALIAP